MVSIIFLQNLSVGYPKADALPASEIEKRRHYRSSPDICSILASIIMKSMIWQLNIRRKLPQWMKPGKNALLDLRLWPEWN